MGCYIEVENKVDWVMDNGTREFMWVPGLKPVIKNYHDYCKDNKLPVILADNGPFIAAGICFNEKEFKAFTHDEDARLRACFTVDIEKLKTVSDLAYYLENK